MLAVRLAETPPDKLEERGTWLALQQARLRSSAIKVLQPGPLVDEGSVPADGLLIVEVDRLDSLRRFSDANPFVVHGIYGQVRIVQWNRAIRRGRDPRSAPPSFPRSGAEA